MLHPQRTEGCLSIVGTECGNTAPALVHIVDIDPFTRDTLTCWLRAAQIHTQAFAHLGEFLDVPRADLPGCLLIDAQPRAICGFELQAILLPLMVPCPIVVTSHRADDTMSGWAARANAMVVAKPLRQQETLAAISTAIEMDRQQRCFASRRAELRARFAALSPRERQVMTLVTRGKMNKQVGGDLGLSEITIKAHRGAAMRKMGARSLPDLVRMADTIAAGV